MLTSQDIGQRCHRKWADYGVKGSDGVFRPDAPLTRAEMATVLSNLMDYKVAETTSAMWLPEHGIQMQCKVNATGVLSGDGSGLASISKHYKEQATSMLARAFAVADATNFFKPGRHPDILLARPAVFGMEETGYVRGFEGKFNLNNITRAEVITIINSAVKAYTQRGTDTENVDGLAVVKVPGVVLKDVVISGNLIAEKVLLAET